MASPKTLKADLKLSKVNWLGKKVTGEHNGSIELKEANLQADGKKFIGGEIIIDMKTIKVLDLQDPDRLKKLTDHLNSDDFFATAKNPVAKLKITSVKLLNKDNYEISGDLTIKDKTNKISFPADIMWQGDNIHTVGKIKIDRTLYDIKYKSAKFFADLGDKMISDDFEVSFDIIAK
jgi:polyisoprenoid-binding protein YceI